MALHVGNTLPPGGINPGQKPPGGSVFPTPAKFVQSVIWLWEFIPEFPSE